MIYSYTGLYGRISERLTSFSDISRWEVCDQEGHEIPLANIVVLGDHNPRHDQNVLENVLKYDITDEWVATLNTHGIINPIAGFFAINPETNVRIFIAVDGYRRVVGAHILSILNKQEIQTIPVYSIHKWINWNQPDILGEMLKLQDLIHVRENFTENARFSRLRTLLHRGIKQKDIAVQLNMTASQVSMWKKAALDDSAFNRVMYERYSVDAALKKMKEEAQEIERAELSNYLGLADSSEPVPKLAFSVDVSSSTPVPLETVPSLSPASGYISLGSPTAPQVSAPSIVSEVYKHIQTEDTFLRVATLLQQGTSWINILTELQNT